MLPRVALLVSFTLGLAHEAHGQRLVPDRFASFALPRLESEGSPTPSTTFPDPLVQPNIGGPIAGGALGGALGLVGGYAIGYALGGGNRDSCGDVFPCGAVPGVIGAMIGEIVLLPVGVHIFNDRRGHFAMDLFTSAGVGALGVLLAATVSEGALSEGRALLVVPIIQLAATVAVERAAGRKDRR